MIRMIMMAGAALALVTVALVTPAAADEAALRQRLQVLKATPAGGTQEKILLRDIGGLMRGLQAKPVPEEFIRRMARGEAALGAARDKGGFTRAANEFRAAAQAAPWRAAAYYNLGIVQDKAGLYDAAMRNLKIYLAVNSDAAARRLLYQIEYRRDEAAARQSKAAKAKRRADNARLRQQQARRKAAEKRRRNERRVASIVGRWETHCPGMPHKHIGRLRPTGPLTLQFDNWMHPPNSPSWARWFLFKYEPSADRFVGHGVSGHNAAIKRTITIIDNNRLRVRMINSNRRGRVGWNTVCIMYRK